MKFLITGGCGFIGCSLVRRLLRDSPGEHGVRVLDSLTVGSREDLGRVCDFSDAGDISGGDALGE
ncbi:MAG: epimerase, partial [Rubrobacter sp.]|nr:epimerase [Rubrobacter sp.]